MPEKAFPSCKTLFCTYARHTICRYARDCFSVPKSARTQADGMLSANTRFSSTSRCPYSHFLSTVLRFSDVCPRHLRNILFHPSSFEPPHPVTHLPRRRMRRMRVFANKKRRKDDRMAVWTTQQIRGQPHNVGRDRKTDYRLTDIKKRITKNRIRHHTTPKAQFSRQTSSKTTSHALRIQSPR